MPIHVVAAIIKKDDKVLITRRADHKLLSGYWEFPGGKVDDGEDPRSALEREIHEELGVRIAVKQFYSSSEHEYDFGTIILDGYICYLCEEVGEIRSTDHDLVVWCSVDKLNDHLFAPADVPIVNRLIEENRGMKI